MLLGAWNESNTWPTMLAIGRYYRPRVRELAALGWLEWARFICMVRSEHMWSRYKAGHLLAMSEAEVALAEYLVGLCPAWHNHLPPTLLKEPDYIRRMAELPYCRQVRLLQEYLESNGNIGILKSSIILAPYGYLDMP